MSEYISTFTTGFGDIVGKQLGKDLPGVRVINVYDGLVHYRFDGNYTLIKKVIYLNNTFNVLSAFKGGNLSFNKMVSATSKEKHKYLINKGSYRVRFSKENQFSKVDKNIVAMAEKHVGYCTNLRIDRVNPTTEIWYIIRSEDVGFYCQLIFKREATEKNLNKGELRPEFAYLMCCCANINSNSIVCDPFCGYGAIPQQLIKGFKVKKVIASDIDKDRVTQLRKDLLSKNQKLTLDVADALNLDRLADESVGAVITDPPWGYYEEIGNIEEFYIKMLLEFKRITKKNGNIIVLSARKQEFTQALNQSGMKLVSQINTLVNGKKAAVFILEIL